ncbi:MAG: leucine-rich repeat domain-containing protein [Pseudomonadota bacterium]
MSAADDAYKAAQAEIAWAKAAGGKTISFDKGEMRALEVMPPEIGELSELISVDLDNTKVADLSPIAQLTNLQRLSLRDTKVTDITPVAQLTNLQVLNLNDTQVADITPVARLANLQELYLNDTQVADLTPLASLDILRSLSFDNTQVADLAPLAQLASLYEVLFSNTHVSDLRPLLSLVSLATDYRREIGFLGTVAAAGDSSLQTLAEIGDYRERTDETLAYLRTLPPWPEPLPWEAPGPSGEVKPEPIDEPDRPDRRPAPLQVAFIDAELREIGSDTDLPADPAARELLGRDALLSYLNDFDEEMLTRIENALPRLGKAMRGLGTALSAEDAFNPVKAGMQGERVRRLSVNATDRLMEDDAEDVAHLAAQIALYLDRFLVWKEYQGDATTQAVDLDEVRADLPIYETIFTELDQSDWVAEEVAQSYKLILSDFTDAPDDLLAAKGLEDATRELTYEISQEAVAEAKKLKDAGEFERFKATYKSEIRTGFAKDAARATRMGLYGGSTGVLAWVLANSSVLGPLAARFPYLKEVLRFLGLL